MLGVKKLAVILHGRDVFILWLISCDREVDSEAINNQLRLRLHETGQIF